MTTRGRRRLGALLFGVPTILSFLLAFVGFVAGQFITAAPASAIPLPLLVYQVESVSGGHTASLLNLPVGQPGVIPQAPTPVDINGDLIPDVTVAVNLIHVDGAFLNPPQIGQVIAPNIQINRLITAPILTPNFPGLKINVKVTIKDSFTSNPQPDMIARFGYDTGPGGSIPQYWKAVVAGLDKMFNPIQAVIDTTGQQLGLHPGISDFRLGPIGAPYQGPLSIIGGFEQGPTKANISLNYDPFPNAVQVTYGTDAEGQHITYAHGVDTEVDLTSKLDLTTADGTTNGLIRIDRLPRAMAIDLNQTSTGGSIDYRSHPNARLPDLQADLTTTSVGKPPLVARADVEGLPAVMHGEWDINTVAQQAHAKFTASGTGVGAIEARVQNFIGAPTNVVPWIPDQRQYASFQQVPKTGGGTEQVIMGRAERLRELSFDQEGGGYKIHAGLGDGEVPFVGHIGLDQRPTGALIEGRAQITPLPSSIDMSFQPPGADPVTQPLKVTYDAAQSFDVDARGEIRSAAAAANAVCGALGTICAEFAGRSIPEHIEARVFKGLETSEGQPEARIEADLLSTHGGANPDFRANVVIGPQGPGDIAPLVADAAIDGLSRYLRIRTVQGADETLQRLEFHTCDYDYDDLACASGTEDEIGAVRANVRDFLVRPANLPPPVSPAPNFIGVTARGDDANADLVLFEAVARVVKIKELQYVNAGGTFGARARIGGGKDLAVDADVKGVRLPQLTPPTQRVDLDAHAVINPLPDTINLCFQNSGGELVDGTDPVTEECQQLEPFSDQSVDKSPIVFDWHASSPFNVLGSAKFRTDKNTPLDPTDDIRAGANIKIDNIPSFLTAKVAVPTGNTSGPVRVLTTGPAGSNINVGLHGEYTVGGADCNDPNPSHDVACADATITKLPTNMSALIDSTKDNSRIEFHACDYHFYAVTPDCEPGTENEIGVIEVDGHLVKGTPGALGVLEPTEDQHVLLQFRQPSENNIALRGRARFEKIRHVAFRQSDDGFDAEYDMGTGLKPLEMKVQADTRKGTLPDLTGLLLAAELLVTNLPAQIKIKQHGPGDGTNGSPMKLTYDASSPVRVQAHAQVFKAAAGANPACGDDGTACATLDLKRVPAHLEAQIGQSEAPASGGGIDHHTVLDVSSDAPIGAKPDLIVDAVLGLPTTTPLVGSVPIRAHAELLGMPRFVTAHMDEHVTNPGLATEQRDLQKVSVRTCQLDNSDDCVSGTEDALDTLALEVQNFLVRPLDFPAPNHGISAPLWATVAARGLLVQAAIQLLNIREATYVNHQKQGSKGFRVKVGTNDDLQARVDIADLPLGNLNFGDLAIQNAKADVLANLLIHPLPDDIAICLREAGRDVVADSGDEITEPCEDTTPFGNDVGVVNRTPMSFAYRASVPIDHIGIDVDAALKGQFANVVGNPPIDARRAHLELGLDNIPTEITAHILTPKEDEDGNAEGATRVRYDAPTINSGDPGINVHFRAHQTQGDSVCQDPRPSATALCVGADLINLPKHVELRYEPDELTDNFHAETNSDTGKMDFKNLELSSVKPKVIGGLRVPGQADVLVATGEILGIAEQITVDGNINMPHDPNKAGSIDLTASISIDEINAIVKNYIAPDPFTEPIPDRPVYKDPGSPANLDLFTVQAAPLPDGRPEFKATASIHNVKGFGFHQISAADGTPVGTNVVNVNFGTDFAVRAYADIVTEDGSHITGDVLLENIPAGLQFCFRGAKDPAVAAPAAGQIMTLCDDETLAAKKDGAFQFIGTPANPELSGLDVDAFVRAAAPGGTDIVSGRLNITDIPYRIDGILPSEHNGGKLDVAAKTLDGDPLGIGEIKFNAASFDFPSGSGDLKSGYTSATPGFVPLTNQTDPFPPPTPSGQYLSAVAAGDPGGSFDFQAVGKLGDADDSVSSSRLQRIFSSATVCTKPTYSDAGPRPDFPLLPADALSTYRCIGGNLQQTQPSIKDPLALSVKYLTQDGTLAQLRNAGINDLPGWFQVDIAKTQDKDPTQNDALRRRCGSEASEVTRAAADIAAYRTAFEDELEDNPLTDAQIAALIVVDCMPPLIRFDQPLGDARLFGVGEIGKPAGLSQLNSTNPNEALANLTTIPTGDGWDTPNDDSISQKGIRAKALTLADGGTAARVNFRLPIPQSVTVDQVQTAKVHGQEDNDHYFDGSDLRFHYVVRDNNGVPVDSLGELSALYQAADGTQVLVGAPCQLKPDERVKNNSLGSFSITTPYDCNPDYRHGVQIPGEIGISMYSRDNLGTGQKFIQVDGRVSTDVSAALRLLGGSPTGVGRVEAELKNLPGPRVGDANSSIDPNVGPDDATFRLQFMQKGDPQTAPTETPPTPPSEPAPEEDCLFCVTSNIRLVQAFVGFNFNPDNATKARRVEATLKQDGAKNGLEVASYSGVNSGGKVPISANAYLLLDPLNISAFLNLAPTLNAIADDIAEAIVDSLGLPGWVEDIIGAVLGAIADLIASLVHVDFTLESRLDASISMHTRHMTLRQNILHVKVVNVEHHATDDVAIGPFDLYIHQLKANANFGITIHTPWPFPDINIGLTLLTIYFLPVASDWVPFLIKYLDCAPNSFWEIVEEMIPALPGDYIHASGSDDANAVIWPLGDNRLILGGIIGNLINAVSSIIPNGRNLGGLFFCIPGVEDADVPLGEPGDSFNVPAGLLWPNHQIFDTDHLADSALGAGAPGGIPAPPADPPVPVPVDPPFDPPPPNGPNFTVFAAETYSLCGIHAFGDLTIQATGTLRVANAADTNDDTGTGANCPSGSEGKLVITTDNLINHGTIDGNAVQANPFTPPAIGGVCPTLSYDGPDGNGGGGHGGAGGKGGTGTIGGEAFANLCTTSPDGQRNASISEIGAPGAGTGAGGNGGGLVVLLANDEIVSDGTIRANGDNGTPDTTGDCAVDGPEVVDNPPAGSGPEDTLLHHNNTGVAAPRGAGGGGGVVLSAASLDLRGTTSGEMTAAGGNGAASKKAGSGGGGGGIVKLLGPVQRYDAGFTPGVGGGTGGANQCAGDGESTAGNGGGAGTFVQIATPTGQATAVAKFWNKGDDMSVPFRASGALQTAGGFAAVLCARFTQTTALTAPETDLRTLFTAPPTSSAASPCGAATELGKTAVPSGTASVEPADAIAKVTFDRLAGSDSGLWGVWVITLRPPAGTSQDCATNSVGCAPSRAPALVDQVFGIDNSNPTVSISAPAAAFLTTSPSVGLTFAPADPDNTGGQHLSGLDTAECRNSAPVATEFAPCSSGASFNLVPGDGPKTIEVRVTDVAGNTGTATVSGILSNSPPTATATIEFPANGSNSWYTNKLTPFAAPTITINNYVQPQGVPAQTSVDGDTGPFRYRFDNLPEEVCTTNPCTVPASAIAGLPAGTHTFSYTAIDQLGNRLFGGGMQTITPFKWDPDLPTTQLDTVPLAADTVVSGNDWFTTRPFVVLSGLDKLGGSGLATTWIKLDGVGPFVAFDINTLTPLTNGIHSVEYYSTDLAGNEEAVKSRINIRVDDAAPDSVANVSGGTMGLAGWYTAPPTVTIDGFDDHGGTGAPANGRFTYRVDNGNDINCNAACVVSPSLLTTGTHLIGRRATDAGGNVHSEQGTNIKVDTQPPLTVISLRSPKPDGLNGWHKSLPYFVLDATDQAADLTHVLPIGSGVAFSEYQLDGGSWVTYTGPFQIAGSHSICARSTDKAGLVETTPLCFPAVKGDDADPTTTIGVAGPLTGSGWYSGNATVTVTSSDPVPGSGLVQPGAVGTPCYVVPPGAPVPAGTCVSVDGRPFMTSVGAYVLGEGVHTVQAYSVDAAGRRSIAKAVTVLVDKSAPVTTIRTLPPYSARNGWFRAVPRVVLRATDGDMNSGLKSTFYKIDSGAFVPYIGPFDIPNGAHTVSYYSVDNAGFIEPTRTMNFKVDTTAPVAIATTPEPAIWLQLLSILGNILGLSPVNAKLHWTIGDQFSGKVSIRTIIYDVTGNVVRQIDGGKSDDNSQTCSPVCTITPGTNLKGYTVWDGKDASLTGLLGVGVYYYRVVVIDDAGNVAMSQEGKPVQIKASLGLL